MRCHLAPPCSHATDDTVGIRKINTSEMHVCLLVCIILCVFPSEVIHDAAVLSLQSQLAGSPSSFYRKLIGSCHWCVKLLCVGQRRQLDYLFFIFSILEQLPSALLLFLNEILFPSVALKDTVCNCSKQSLSWRFGIQSHGVDQNIISIKY